MRLIKILKPYQTDAHYYDIESTIEWGESRQQRFSFNVDENDVVYSTNFFRWAEGKHIQEIADIIKRNEDECIERERKWKIDIALLEEKRKQELLLWQQEEKKRRDMMADRWVCMEGGDGYFA